MGNKSEVTIARAILIHSIMRGEEDIIADNMAVIAQGLQSKGNLGFPGTIYKLCKDAGVPLREFRRTSKIPEEKMMMKMNQCLKREEAMMKKRSSSSNMITSSHHSKVFQIYSHVMKANTMKTSKALKSTSLACSFSSKASMKTCRNRKPITWKR
ncbi:hypothetical protein PIB30_099904 [Stylosanthes scabra]|uniref:Uncharacterized protein n=1 Tax=Stylosanthes scabra TaxID=79078 RepID=A0ABU6RYC5_9FABA|nr:hypothetical protein [Stylosanthes scabra]